MTILLLTKSLNYEQEFVHNLNDLGHEVLCSKKFLSELQTKGAFGMDLNYFDLLILSETISDQEVSKILPFFLNFTCAIYRKTIHPATPETVSYWERLGITDFISQNTQFDELREKLIACNQNRTTLEWKVPKGEKSTLDMVLHSLSKQELQVFKILQNSQKNYISREELSQKVWGESPTKSKESRLSMIISNIKRKLGEFGFDEDYLETTWGRGYCLGELKLKRVNTKSSGELKDVEP